MEVVLKSNQIETFQRDDEKTHHSPSAMTMFLDGVETSNSPKKQERTNQHAD